MRHHAEDIALAVADTGDVVQSAILTPELTIGVAVPEQNLVMRFKVGQTGIISQVAAFGMGDRHLEDLTFLATIGHQGVGRLYAEADIFGNKLVVFIAYQCSWQKSGFA